MKLNFSPTL